LEAIEALASSTSSRVVYRKPKGELGLVAREIVDPSLNPDRQTEFLADAWILANRQARLLGWIV
jgi:hypothetical protein